MNEANPPRTVGATPSAPPTDVPVAPAPWHRLDPRMLVVGPAGSLLRLLPVIVVLLITGQGFGFWRVGFPLVLAGAVVVAGIASWATTRYRITPERVELRTGWLRRQRRSVPRDRIRTVDLTAPPVHRIFRLAVVKVAAAEAGSGLDLNAVSAAEGERLRRTLLDRAPVAASPAGPAAAPVVLARLDWSWLRYAPLTLSSLAAIGAVGAALVNIVDDLGLDPRDLAPVDAAADRLASTPLWLGVAAIALTVLAVASAGAVVLFAERWYGYLLTREPDGTIRVRRGLLTRRSLSVAEARLRGAEIVEPLLLRAGRGAQARALTTGLSGESHGGALAPPTPRGEAQRVASAVLREHPAEITAAPLRPHPPAARARRLTRALAPAAVVVALAWWVGTLTDAGWPGPLSLTLLPLALLLGLDRARNLGHALTARHLVARGGSLRRRTVAVQRTGVVGWAVRQSVFQRRAGLVTLEAVTAAGEGGYAVLDVGAVDAVALADAATPGLLTPFRAPR